MKKTLFMALAIKTSTRNIYTGRFDIRLKAKNIAV